jgi:hypothetical protein
MVGAGLAHAAGPAWLEVSSTDGKRNWFVPEGWNAAKGVDEEVGDMLLYEEPGDGGGQYWVQGIAKERGDTCPGVVEKVTGNPNGKAQKGVYCSEGKRGELKIGACAREDKKGYIVLLVISAKPKTYQALGGVAKLRDIIRKTYGIAPLTT